MLTQKISKEIFYIYSTKTLELNPLKSAVNEFERNLQNLEKGNEKINIFSPPTATVKEQLKTIRNLWQPFVKNVAQFQANIKNRSDKKLQNALEYVARHNIELMLEADKAVQMYTEYSIQRRDKIEKFQLSAAIVIAILVIYSIVLIKGIKITFENFIQKSKNLASLDVYDKSGKPAFNIGGTDELHEANDYINSFIGKVEGAIERSQKAKDLSADIADDLANMSEELAAKLGDFHLDEKSLKKALDASEDIAIQSSEEIINTLNMLEKLKSNLDSISKKCSTFKQS